MIKVQKSTSKTQWLLTLPKSRFQEEEQMQTKNGLKDGKRNEVHRLTFKEREQKVYPFPNEDVPIILGQLLQLKLIKLPECRRPEDMGKVDDPNYCKYHRIIGHPIQKCFIFKEQIMKLAKENTIDLNFNEVVGSNHVTIACDVLPTLKQGANTNQAYKVIDNDGIRIGPINGKFLKHFYAWKSRIAPR